MTIHDALILGTKKLKQNNIQDSYFEARTLLCHVLKQRVEQMYLNSEHQLNSNHYNSYINLIKRRLKHEPTYYILKRREFYGFDFYVNRNVLIPRPETELLVDESIKYLKSNYRSTGYIPVVADVGTGSGIIAICLALNFMNAKIYATDISSKALKVAKANCDYHHVRERVILLKGDLISPVPEPIDLIIANLPYIRRSEIPFLDPEIIQFEPRIAIDGGRDGLFLIRKLLKQAKMKIKRGGCIFMEVGYDQADKVKEIATKYYFNSIITYVTDLNGIARVIKISN